MNFFGTAPAFLVFYILLLLPIYQLPFQGPDHITPSPYMLHLSAFITLVGLTWARGHYLKKEWIVIFPIVAGLFDVMPFLSTVPYVLTVFHALAIAFGLALHIFFQPSNK